MKWNTWTILLGGICFFANVNTLLAQPTKVHKAFENDIYQKARALLNLTQATDIQEVEGMPSLKQLDKLLNYSFTQLDTLQRQLFDEEAKVVGKDLGLAFSARYTWNGDLVNEEGGIEPGSRWRAGLEWNILEDGYFDRNKKTKKLANERELFQLQQHMKKRGQNYPYIYNKIIATFNEYKIELLHERIPFMEAWLEVLEDLYYLHDVKFTDVLDVRKKIESGKALLDTYQGFNTAFRNYVEEDTLMLHAKGFPVVEIDIDELLSDTMHQHLMDKMIEIEEQAVALRDDYNKLPRLKVFGNYNIRTQDYAYNQSYTSAGALFNMPLDFSRKEKKNVMDLEKAMIREKADFAIYNNTRELLNLYTEYNYNLKAYIDALHKRARLVELLRIEKVLLEYDKRGHSPLSALRYQELVWTVEIELTDIMQMMYLKLAQIATKSHHSDFMSCLKIKTFEEIGKKLQGIRYVTLTQQDVEENFKFLTNYLEKNEFKAVILKNGVELEYFKKLEEAGFYVYPEFNPELAKLDFKKVPTDKFFNRSHLEFWVSTTRRGVPKSVFLFESLDALIELDRKNKQLTSN